MPRLGIPQVEVPYNFLSGEKLLELPKMINICFHDSDSHSIFEPFTLHRALRISTHPIPKKTTSLIVHVYCELLPIV